MPRVMHYNRPGVRHLPDTFSHFAPARALIDGLISSQGEFAHLRRAKLPTILSQRALVERGRAVPVCVMEPQHGATSSARRNLVDWLIAEFVRPVLDGFEADYLIVFDTALWPDTDPHEAEHVCYHALCHIEQRQDEYGAPRWHDDGTPLLRLRSHDIERFNTEVARYGSTVQSIKDEHGTYAAARGRARGEFIGGRGGYRLPRGYSRAAALAALQPDTDPETLP